MEYIKKEDLIEGEIYKSNLYGHIFKYLDKDKDQNPHCIKESFGKDSATVGNGLKNISIATQEEKHWLNTCIEADKFVTFEESMKTFEKEFTLPENWHIICTIENQKILTNWRTNMDYLLPIDYLVGMAKYPDRIIKGHNPKNSITSKIGNSFDFGKEITFEQFKKYVLKEVEIIDILPQFKILKSIETITEVENNEGSIFRINDIVKSDSDQKGKILKFRYSANKSNIIAITEFQSTNGIGINSLEHHIEAKEETLLEKAKRLYPLGTEFYASRGNGIYYKVRDNSVFRENNGAICTEDFGNGTVYFNDVWAEIIK